MADDAQAIGVLLLEQPESDVFVERLGKVD
jgi:hypothetical protein